MIEGGYPVEQGNRKRRSIEERWPVRLDLRILRQGSKNSILRGWNSITVRNLYSKSTVSRITEITVPGINKLRWRRLKRGYIAIFMGAVFFSLRKKCLIEEMRDICNGNTRIREL